MIWGGGGDFCQLVYSGKVSVIEDNLRWLGEMDRDQMITGKKSGLSNQER